MVEFVSDSNDTSTADEPLHTSKLKQSNNPLEPLDSKADDHFLADSFFDYESIRDWIEELASPVMADEETVVFQVDEKRSDSTVEGHFINQRAPASDPTVDRPAPIVCEVEPVVAGSAPAVVQGKGGASNESTDLNGIIEEGMSKVSLVSGSGTSVLVGGNIVKCELDYRKEDSGSDVESDDSSSESTSSSSSSSGGESRGENDDEEGISGSSSSGDSSCHDEAEFTVIVKRDGEIGDLEEGEIRDVAIPDGTDADSEDEEAIADHMVAWTGDSADEEEDEEAEVKRGPICSKNELKVLPPVPRVDARLQAHHQMLPVGVVLSVIGNQVIVEGVEKHDPLTEDSVLWITESRFPLGLVDEIFGPVKNPYYSVRYNSEREIPTGIRGGTHISFVPEFANHILNNKDLYKKGYDASGMNDEEVSDEAEFSDDEKELEFKRMQTMAKRAMNDNNHDNKNNFRKKKSSAQARKFSQSTSQHANVLETSQQPRIDTVQPSSNQNQHGVSPSASFIDQGNSSAPGPGFINGAGMVVPSFPPMYNPCFTPTLNGTWPSQMPFQQQQQQNPFFPNAFPLNGMPWLPNPALQTPPMPMPPHAFTGLPYPHPPGPMGAPLPMPGTMEQGIHSSGQFGQNQNFRPPLAMSGSMEATQQQFRPGNLQPPAAIPENVAATQPQFNPGAYSRRGRRPYGRGGSHFRGRRGSRQT